MKTLDIAIKDLRRSFRSVSALAFMFGIPLLVTGMFYLMFGNAVKSGSFDLPRIQVVVANLDQSAPRLQAGRLPEGIRADTMSELIVAVLSSDEMEDLLEVTTAVNAVDARTAVDRRKAQVAVIIPDGFSHAFADVDDKAVLEMYHDPTLAIGPSIVRAVLGRFMDSISGVKIAVDQALDAVESGSGSPELVGVVLEDYLSRSRTQSKDPAEEFLEIQLPVGIVEESNPLLALITPIMGGMMIFYAYFTGVTSAQSILREDEEHTLARLFTTPTPRREILTGKFLAVFLTVMVQVITLIAIARLIFGIQWGQPLSIALAALGVILTASTFGIFTNSFIKNTRQSGMLFGGVVTITGMLGMVRIFAMNSPAAARLGDTVGLLVPQGWAVRGLLEAVNGRTPAEMIPTLLALLGWSLTFATLGIWRFGKRFA